MNILSKLRLGWGVVLTLGLLVLASCSETIDTEKQRRSDNEKAFNAYNNDKDYEQVTLPGNFGDRYVYMKWEHKAEDRTKKPKATDYIRMRYTGKLLTSKAIFEKVDAENINTLKSSRVSSYIAGMSIALQNMALGDKATIAIPWFLAYGADNTRVIPSYSALIFDVELVDISAEEN